MHADALHHHLAAHFEPFHGAYRAAAILRDGTHLPCVRFVDRARTLESLAHFHASGEMDGLIDRNMVVAADIARVEASPYAWPAHLLQDMEDREDRIGGRFVAETHDARYFAFDPGEDPPHFLDLPDGCRHDDVRTLYFGRRAQELTAQLGDTRVYTARPYFLCLVEGLHTLA